MDSRTQVGLARHNGRRCAGVVVSHGDGSRRHNSAACDVANLNSVTSHRDLHQVGRVPNHTAVHQYLLLPSATRVPDSQPRLCGARGGRCRSHGGSHCSASTASAHGWWFGLNRLCAKRFLLRRGWLVCGRVCWLGRRR